MKFKKLIPLISVPSIAVTLAPMCLTSCAKYQNLNLKEGYTPKVKPKEHTIFKSIGEANNYYAKADKNVIIQDYLWTMGEYFKEKMEFPSPILPFKFIDIEQVSISIENWWTNIDDDNKSYFQSSFDLVCKLSGQTQARNGMNNYGSYIPDSFATVMFKINANKLPSVLVDTEVVNTTEARWQIRPADDSVLQSDNDWNISAYSKFYYLKKNSHDEQMATTDELSIYWYKDFIYNKERDDSKSYIFPFINDCLTFGSYHLQNCELKPA